MESFVLPVPAMYADHHVVEVRAMLLESPGVEAVDASSSFRTVEVSFDPDRVTAEALRQRLEDAGYLNDLPVPLESGEPVIGGEGDGLTYLRHSTAHEIVGGSVGFEQDVVSPGRPLWPCPGFDRAPSEVVGEDE